MCLPGLLRRCAGARADAYRDVYETLELRSARHPSESDRYLVTRVLARLLEHDEGVDFGKGLSEHDEPALWRRDLRGDALAWIEVGCPAAERLHRASKLCPRVAVYGWRLDPLLRELATATVHRKEQLALFAFEQAFLDRVVERLDKVNRWSLSVSGATLYLEVGGKLLEGPCERLSIP